MALGRKYGRKRKLIWDEEKVISNHEMRMNIEDSSNTVVAAPAMAPPTKFLMHWKKNGGVEKILGVPGRPLHSHALLGGFKNRLIAKTAEDEYFNMLGDHETEGIELKYAPGEKELQQLLDTKGRPGRKPKNPKVMKAGPMVKIETVQISFASDLNQSLDLTRVKSEGVKQGVITYDANSLSSVLVSANAPFKTEDENRIMRILGSG